MNEEKNIEVDKVKTLLEPVVAPKDSLFHKFSNKDSNKLTVSHYI